MTPDEFRNAGHQLIDWISDYRANLEQMPVRAQVKPGDIHDRMPPTPTQPVAQFTEMLDQLQQVVVPGITQVQHPMHFGWFPSNASLASVLGDIACSGLGTLGISWESCPALTEVEEVVCNWMRQLTGLSPQWEGTIHDTASTACLTALLVAREKASDFSQNRRGLQGESTAYTVYATAEAHSSITKSALLAGYGKENLRMVEVDPVTQAMSVAHLERLVEADVGAGKRPAVIVASAGSTGVTAFDPIAQIASIANRHNVWLHVDAAMAGSAMMLAECRHLWDGVENADSICWNPHKWMGTILDCSLFYVRDPELLIRVMSTNPSYLRSTVDNEVTQYRDWGIPLGRRFRALKLWFHLAIDGPDAICDRLRRDLQNARWLATEITATSGWQVLVPVTLQTLCIRHQPAGIDGDALDRHTLEWVGAINQSGKAFMSPSLLGGRWMVRISIGVEASTRGHIVKLWEMIQAAAEQSLKSKDRPTKKR